MVTARVEVSFGKGTRSSPGIAPAISAGVAPHRLYQRRVTGAVIRAEATWAPPSIPPSKSRAFITSAPSPGPVQGCIRVAAVAQGRAKADHPQHDRVGNPAFYSPLTQARDRGPVLEEHPQRQAEQRGGIIPGKDPHP